MQPFATPAEDPSRREACRLESLGRPAELSAAARAELERLFTRYPTREAVVVPALWIAQREFGWISAEVIVLVSRLCGVAPSHVYGVVSFYTMFHRRPRGRLHLQLCTNLSCQLRGAEHVLDCLREKLGIDLGGTTDDRLFSLDEVECLAACELAPVLQVTETRCAENDTFVGPLDGEAARMLIDELRARAEASPAPMASVGPVTESPRESPGASSESAIGLSSHGASGESSRGGNGAPNGGWGGGVRGGPTGASAGGAR
jgi:NADH-quinone oxidoreductase E subunit